MVGLWFGATRALFLLARECESQRGETGRSGLLLRPWCVCVGLSEGGRRRCKSGQYLPMKIIMLTTNYVGHIWTEGNKGNRRPTDTFFLSSFFPPSFLHISLRPTQVCDSFSNKKKTPGTSCRNPNLSFSWSPY
jgi:hypothetical protein